MQIPFKLALSLIYTQKLFFQVKMTNIGRKAKYQKASNNPLFEHQEFKVSNAVKKTRIRHREK